MSKIIPILLLLLASCTHHAENQAVAQMRVRGMQTRSFIGIEGKTVMKEVIAVLQDEGYIVKNVSHDLGLLTAELDTNIEKFASKFFAYLFSGRSARWKHRSVVEMTSNVTEEEGKSKLRINFAVRVFDNTGRVVDLHQIHDKDAYQEFFNKVQRGLIHTQGV